MNDALKQSKMSLFSCKKKEEKKGPKQFRVSQNKISCQMHFCKCFHFQRSIILTFLSALRKKFPPKNMFAIGQKS